MKSIAWSPLNGVVTLRTVILELKVPVWNTNTQIHVRRGVFAMFLTIKKGLQFVRNEKNIKINSTMTLTLLPFVAMVMLLSLLKFWSFILFKVMILSLRKLKLKLSPKFMKKLVKMTAI